MIRIQFYAEVFISYLHDDHKFNLKGDGSAFQSCHIKHHLLRMFWEAVADDNIYLPYCNTLFYNRLIHEGLLESGLL